MPRRPRFEAANAVHHVYNRGVDRIAIFGDDDDRQYYLDLLGTAVHEWEWDCLDYCLMGNHIHLLVRTREPTLGRGMHRIHSIYAAHFNERHGRVGHLFQNRYGSSRLRSPWRLRYVANYIAMNPVEAQFCAKPEDWRWSSVAARASRDRPRWLASRHVVAGIYEELAATT